MSSRRLNRRETVSALGTESWEPVDLNIALNEGSSTHVNGWKVDVIQVKRASSNGSFVSLEIHELRVLGTLKDRPGRACGPAVGAVSTL